MFHSLSFLSPLIGLFGLIGRISQKCGQNHQFLDVNQFGFIDLIDGISVW